MNATKRIENVEAFVEKQRFLAGSEYRVIYDEDQDILTIEIKALTEGQMELLKVSLRQHLMRHVKVNVIKLLPPVKKQNQQPLHGKPNQGKLLQ